MNNDRNYFDQMHNSLASADVDIDSHLDGEGIVEDNVIYYDLDCFDVLSDVENELTAVEYSIIRMWWSSLLDQTYGKNTNSIIAAYLHGAIMFISKQDVRDELILLHTMIGGTYEH